MHKGFFLTQVHSLETADLDQGLAASDPYSRLQYSVLPLASHLKIPCCKERIQYKSCDLYKGDTHTRIILWH